MGNLYRAAIHATVAAIRSPCAILLLCAAVFSGCGGERRPKAEAERAYIAATDAYGAEKYEEALTLVKQALSRDRKFYQAEFLKGKILFFAGGEGEADTIFAPLVSRYPEYTEARIWHIRCLILGGDFEKGRSLIERELSFNSSDWRIYYLYSLLAQKTGDYEKRLSMNRHAETALTDSAKVYMDMALAWQALGLEERAGDYLEKARHVSGANISLQKFMEEFK
jgi:tetratricopeptide (TPR) repeat protein